jgi:ABC-type hemin transport system ATPase subunit
VADVSFSVARGEVFGFLGPNGARGKPVRLVSHGLSGGRGLPHHAWLAAACLATAATPCWPAVTPRSRRTGR